MADKEDLIIGIDLGTKYCCVGVWHNGHIEIIPDEKGYKTTPSCVAFTQSQRLVGHAALSQAAFNPMNTIFDSKRFLGRRFSDESVQRDITSSLFKVILGPGDKPMFAVDYKGKKRQFAPEKITSMLLARMREIAERYIGSTTINAIISVPAHFTNAQRLATKEAGALAGLNIIGLINDPTAAAIAYGLQNDATSFDEKNVLLFDLGGGTFDVSLLTIGQGIIQVKSTAGDNHIGGEEFDTRMVEMLVKRIANVHNRDISGDPVALIKLKQACESAKKSLSYYDTTTINIHLCNGFHFLSIITAGEFQLLNMSLFTKICIELVLKCLTEAKMEKSDVDDILLVGGSSRIPMVQLLLKDLFDGKEFCTGLDPDEDIAYGAAAQAAIIGGVANGNIEDISWRDITPMALGLGTGGGLMDVVIPHHTAIPHMVERVITTESNNQSRVSIGVYEGNVFGKIRRCKNLLVEVELNGIPPAPKGVPKITVRFEIDKDGIFDVFVKDTSGQKKKLIVANGKATVSMENVEIDYVYGGSFLTWLGSILGRGGTQRLLRC